jgi:hypothetical protein
MWKFVKAQLDVGENCKTCDSTDRLGVKISTRLSGNTINRLAARLAAENLTPVLANAKLRNVSANFFDRFPRIMLPGADRQLLAKAKPDPTQTIPSFYHETLGWTRCP